MPNGARGADFERTSEAERARVAQMSRISAGAVFSRQAEPAEPNECLERPKAPAEFLNQSMMMSIIIIIGVFLCGCNILVFEFLLVSCFCFVLVSVGF